MTIKICIRTLVWLLILLVAAPPAIFAQPPAAPTEGQAGTSAPAPLYTQEQLDQMLAPIALYPDSLLVQVLMGATYPLEIVEADRWLHSHQNLQGDQLAAAVDRENWDPSVKSLVNIPSVLGMLSEKLEWTERLGEAFLAQKDQVMDTVQKLRAAAQAQGNLKTTPQQSVVTEGQTIVIEPADPQVVYVPAYDPLVVYGPWWYPDYPPYPYYPLGAVILGGVISFGIGIALGACWGWAWGGFGWSHHNVTVNVFQNTNFNRHINRNFYSNRVGGGGHGSWQHDPTHRRGVAYRDSGLSQRYGHGAAGSPGARSAFRGQTPAPGRGGALGGVSRGGQAAQMQGQRGRQSRTSVASPRGGTSGRGISRTPGGTSMGRPGGGAMTQPRGSGSTGMARPGGGSGMARPGGGGGGMGHPGGGGGGGHPGGGHR